MNRMIPDFSKEDSVNKLSLLAEVFFRRLWNKADDFGRYDGRPLILKAELFPLRDIRIPDISRCLLECEIAGLIVNYKADGGTYLFIKNFNQRVRAAKSKYPQPPNDCQTNDGQLSDICRPEVEVEVEEKKGGDKPPDFDFFSILPAPFGESEEFRTTWESWLKYRRERKLAKWTESTLRIKAKQFAEWGVEATITAIRTSIAQGWQGVFPDKKPSKGQNSPPLAELKLGLRYILGDTDNKLPEEIKALKAEDVASFERYVPSEYEQIKAELAKPFSKMKDYVQKNLEQ